jgi:hypothetical protein
MKVIRYLCTDCGEERSHRIGLTKKGQLVALDHSPKFRREKNFASLGGTMPSCYYAVTQLLRGSSYVPAGLPAALQEESLRAHLKHQRRNREPWQRNRRPMTVAEKYTAMTRLAAVAALNRCYFDAPDKKRIRTYNLPHPGSLRLDFALVGRVSWSVLSGTHVMTSEPSDPNCLTLRLPTRWWRNVHMKGIDVLDGHLVVDAHWDNGHRVFLTVLCQQRDGKFFTMQTEQPAVRLNNDPESVRFGPAPWGCR